MSMSCIGAGCSNAHSQLAQILQQRRQDFDSMANAVQSGDMSGAQQALTALQQDQAGLQAARPSQTAWGVTGVFGGGNNPLSADLTTLVQDVQSGDLTGAQQALQQFEQDRAQVFGDNSGATSADSSTGMSPIQQDTEALIKAIEDGDAAGAKQDLATLQNDLKTYGPSGHHHHHRIDADSDGDGAGSTADSTTTDQTASSDTSPADRSRLFAVLTAYLGQNAPQASANVVA